MIENPKLIQGTQAGSRFLVIAEDGDNQLAIRPFAVSTCKEDNFTLIEVGLRIRAYNATEPGSEAIQEYWHAITGLDGRSDHHCSNSQTDYFHVKHEDLPELLAHLQDHLASMYFPVLNAIQELGVTLIETPRACSHYMAQQILVGTQQSLETIRELVDFATLDSIPEGAGLRSITDVDLTRVVLTSE
ncbi:MAG: hypothetical protein OEX12_12695 [Gammaproteobacteria bacterium]|nr:hypothetical protein [Gammaproteobacteria bacterium]